jgi:hypothetical protein
MELTDIQLQILEGKICPYCKQPSKLVDSKVVYGKSYGMIYLCQPCQAWVGVHKIERRRKFDEGPKALGRLANAELREAKKEAHKYFDMIWKLKIMTRKEAYDWLSNILSVPRQFTHIGMFSIKTCKDVVYFSKQLMNDNRRLDLDFGAEPVTQYFELN